MKLRKNKKGFTIVELVIVIAVIGVLAAVLIPTFINLTDKANKAADDSLVKNLNTALATQEGVPGDTKNNTLHDAIVELEEYGYKLPNLVTKSGENSLLWNRKTNRFLLEKDIAADKSANKTVDVDYFHIQDNIPSGQKYSVYAGNGFNEPDGGVTVSVGFDAGFKAFSEINYSHTSGDDQKVVIRTNGGTLTINAENDEVTHYGQVDYVDIIAVKPASYEERGTTSLIKVAKGNVALNSESKVGEIHFAKTGDVFTDIKVTLENGAQLPDLSRDPVGISLSSDVLVCEVVTSGTSEYYWLSGNATIEDEKVLVSSDKAGTTKTAATAESSTAVAIANAKIGEEVSDPGATVKAASEMTPEEITEATAAGAAKTFAEIGSKEELKAFRDAWNAGKIANGGTYKLTANIDISGENWYPIGSWEFPFNGTFDGNGKTINGLYANSADADHKGTYANNSTVGFGETFGFFGIVGGGNTTVQNVSFANVNIEIYDGKDVGAVIGYAPSNGKFKNSTKTKDQLDNDHKGDSMVEIEPYKSSTSFLGKWNDNTLIGTHEIKLSGITVNGNIKAKSAVGGIAGKLYNSGKVEVLSCTNNANISGGSNTSGIVGYIHYSNDITVDGNTNTGAIRLTGGAGIVHLNDLGNKKIINNTNTGNIIYDAAYSKTSSQSYSWDFIATGAHNSFAYTEFSGNTNTGKFYVQDAEEPENTKGVLVVDAGETVTIDSVSEYNDVVVNGTLNINAATSVYGCLWVQSSGVLNVNAALTVTGTQGYLSLKNNSLTVGTNGSIDATYIIVPNNYTITNNGTIRIRVSVSGPSDSSNGLKKNNLTFVNNGTFIADSSMYYGDGLNFTNNGTYQGNMLLTGSATVVNTANGKYEAHNGNGIDFRGGSGSFTNQAEAPFGTGFDGVSIWVAGTYTVEGCNAHLGAGITNLDLTHEGNTWTATNK